MKKDPTAFRERFKAWKEGKSITDIYDGGLPKYDEGDDLKKIYYDAPSEFLDWYSENGDTVVYDDSPIIPYYESLKNGSTKITEEDAVRSTKSMYDLFPERFSYYAGELPEITVRPDPNSKSKVTLTTYYPVTSIYPYTGHSELRTEGGNRIDVSSDDPGYNLLFNNCSDATRIALEKATGKKINPYFFTTPGDVKDFAEKELGGSSRTAGTGRTITTMYLPTERVRKIAEYSKYL